MTTAHSFSVNLTLLENYVFKVDFGDMGDILTDEAPPLGNGEGPNPSRLVAAAVGNCLCASLLFALRKAKEQPGGVSAVVTGDMERQDGRWRIGRIDVKLQVENAQALQQLPAVLEKFEDYCIVTQSIRQGIPVHVEVVDQDGKVLKG
ncbi:MAG: OsmC family protein [Gammaproteobacteria bacterium]|nr:OsmC family protein [Gammaproteobacteria bacterium]